MPILYNNSLTKSNCEIKVNHTSQHLRLQLHPISGTEEVFVHRAGGKREQRLRKQAPAEVLQPIAHLNGARLLRDFRHAGFGGETTIGLAQRIERTPVPRATKRVPEKMMDHRLPLRGGILFLTIPCTGRDACRTQDCIPALEHLEVRQKIVFGRQDGGIACEDERKVVLIAEHEVVAHILHVFKYPFGAAPPPPFRDIHHQNARIELWSVWRQPNQLLVLVAEAVVADGERLSRKIKFAKRLK